MRSSFHTWHSLVSAVRGKIFIRTMEELLKLPPQLKLCETKAYGRGVYATSDLVPGTEILVSEPFLHVVANDYRGSRCDVCLKSSESLRKCSQCKYVYYCGKDCQRKDWSLHKNECKALKSVQPQWFPDVTRLVFRLIQKKKLKDSGKEIDLLQSNQDFATKERQEEMYYNLMEVTGLLHRCGWGLMMMNANNVLYKVVCNKFAITDWNMKVIASGLYLLPSMFNHSCTHNCEVIFDGLQLSIHTIKHVKCDEQLFVSYVDVLQPKEKRLTSLSHIYSFQCSCERCHGEDEVATGLMAAASDDIPATVLIETIEEGYIKLGEIDKLKKVNDWKGSLDLCKQLIAQYKSVLSPRNFITVRLLQEMTESMTKLEQWAEILAPAKQLLELYEHHLPEYDVNLTVLLYNLSLVRQAVAMGSHDWELMKIAIADLSKARDLLYVSHGAGHSLTVEVEQLLRELLSAKCKIEAQRQAKSMQ